MIMDRYKTKHIIIGTYHFFKDISTFYNSKSYLSNHGTIKPKPVSDAAMLIEK